MDLRLTFGWHLDGPAYPDTPAVGRLAVGPIGMLNQLALRLGLLSAFPPTAVRIGKYLAALAALDGGNQFYSNSFRTDSWGTARALLRLRDELVYSGWRPEDSAGASARLEMLARLEGQFQSACVTDLCADIAETLESRSLRLPITRVCLMDRKDSLPPVWQRIIKGLLDNSVTIESSNLGTGGNGSDIAKLAANLKTRKAAQKLSGDGTVALIEADDEVQAADFVASWMASYSVNESGLVLIRGSSTSFLDLMLKKSGLPMLGNSVASSQRGYLQLLTLALETCWKPVNPARVIEFLTLPYSPVPQFIGGAFINALRNQPGIGGGEWQSAWQTARQRQLAAWSRRDGGSPSDETLEDKLKEVESTWRQWLEPPTFDAGEGMPALHIVAVCKRVREHALARFATIGHEVFARTAACADTLGSAIEAAGVTNVPRAQLDRILDSVIGDGYSADSPQAGAWTAVDHPGQICAPVNTTLWWGFISNVPQPRANAWTDQELAHLKRKKVLIEQPSAKITREAESWRRPIQAGERILFMKPRTVSGRQIAPHPFFHEVIDSLETATPLLRPLILRQSHNIYRLPEWHICGRTMARHAVEQVSLPRERAVWKLTSGLPTIERESPTGVQSLLGCPLNWVLRYRAKVRQGNLLTVAEGEQLAGNLAHAVFAALFSEAMGREQAEIAERAEAIFDQLCPQIAAPLLLPGNSLERMKLRKAVSEGAAHLSQLISKAGFTEIECESPRNAVFDQVQFHGRPDLFLRHEGENDFVIDLKWAARSAYRRREIAEGRAIQLAIYSWLCSQETRRPTSAGYYMLAQNQLLSDSPRPFPSHMSIKGASLPDTFDKIAAAYLAHMKVLSGGTVYATGIMDDLIEQSPSSMPGDEIELKARPVPGVDFSIEPPCKFCDYKRLCGKQGFGA